MSITHELCIEFGKTGLPIVVEYQNGVDHFAIAVLCEF